MSLFSNSLFILIASLALTSCTKNQSGTETAASETPALQADVEEIRTILIQNDSNCQLSVKRGRNEPELISPKSCKLTKSTAGDITSVTLVFDPPCKQYVFNNLIGTLYFLDEKSIASKNKACRVESFKSSYGWSISS